MVAAFTDGLAAHLCWHGLTVGGRLALSLHSSSEPCELWQWLLL